MKEIKLGKKTVGSNCPAYFIADIAANHDGDLERAKELIYMCAEAGADAAKFQHFSAKTIVSDVGFKSLGSQKSHQSKWKKSVFDIYQDAALNLDWTPILKETCEKAGIDFLTSPYSLALVDAVDLFVPAYKIGSGDITWLEIIDYIAQKRKPVLLATGAANFDDVKRAMDCVLAHTTDIILMQCNTNYTASLENFKYINLNVLKYYASTYPDVVLGLSDHTPGHATVLGAVTLGARVIEKHFTNDVTREGPDHRFSMSPITWRDMVDRTRELENALGIEEKKVEENEMETVVLQRRAIRVSGDLKAGTVLTRQDIDVLRPCPSNALPPYQINDIIGRVLIHDVNAGENLKWSDLE
ncbi:MAG: N-acetylneuraminate synthase [Gammaproteobacteria bacterium CG_4_10_14_0_8_um_filter_38_16]|nr:MAG: N-acetylneuraminate synthase [Gammaproteobacteria bacterium CG_4_10_14_0_8_um_filter_38_16]PJA04098.1 MAG: N-acetylneuraminate synthase [Gammaproteobacteria bacterium CG_4_10_14_0_2_um_filter_38_22]PJB10036.1 MAG: N-acetylneuraminate synthase [Gammaproteobacteria bacterium CG_4_9_14_3_um_filter_38_9]